MIKEHDMVALTVDLPDMALEAGDMGVVVGISPSGEHYELEMFTADHKTLDVISVHRSQVRPLGKADILHARTRD
jgi:hypothetical protein